MFWGSQNDSQCSLKKHISKLEVWFFVYPRRPPSPPRFGKRPDFFRIFFSATFPYILSLIRFEHPLWNFFNPFFKWCVVDIYVIVTEQWSGHWSVHEWNYEYSKNIFSTIITCKQEAYTFATWCRKCHEPFWFADLRPRQGSPIQSGILYLQIDH